MIKKLFNNTRQIGSAAEQKAARYLKKHGLKHLSSNYNCKLGEIDLIMQHGDVLVFVEVRYRKSSNHGLAEETINSKKMSKIRNTALHYIQVHKINSPVRFDVVAISGDNEQQINWIENAF